MFRCFLSQIQFTNKTKGYLISRRWASSSSKFQLEIKQLNKLIDSYKQEIYVEGSIQRKIELLLKYQQLPPLGIKKNVIEELMDNQVLNSKIDFNIKKEIISGLECMLIKQSCFYNFKKVDSKLIALINAFSKFSNYGNTRILIDKMLVELPDKKVAYEKVIEACLITNKIEYINLAHRYFKQSIEQNIILNDNVVYKVVNQLLNDNKIDKVIQIYHLSETSQVKFNGPALNKLIMCIDGYEQHLDFKLELLDKMQQQNFNFSLHLINIYIKTYYTLLKKEESNHVYVFSKIKQILQLAKTNKLKLENYSYSILLRIFKLLIKLDKGRYINQLNKLFNEEIEMDKFISTELINIYSDLKEMDKIEDTIELLCRDNIIDKILLDNLLKIFIQHQLFEKADYYYQQLTQPKELYNQFKFQLVECDDRIKLKYLIVLSNIKSNQMDSYYKLININSPISLNLLLSAYFNLFFNRNEPNHTLWKIQSLFNKHKQFHDIKNYELMFKSYYIYTLKNNLKDIETIDDIWKLYLDMKQNNIESNNTILNFILKSIRIIGKQSDHLKLLLNQVQTISIDNAIHMLNIAKDNKDRNSLLIIENKFKANSPSSNDLFQFYHFYFPLMNRFNIPGFQFKVNDIKARGLKLSIQMLKAYNKFLQNQKKQKRNQFKKSKKNEANLKKDKVKYNK